MFPTFRNMLPNKTTLRVLTLTGVLCLVALPISANQDLGYVLNSFSFLIWGVLVMWMCAGFTMLESGTVRTKNASVICLKNLGLFSIACITYYIIGYDLMYNEVWHFIGKPFQNGFGHGPSAVEVAMLTDSTNNSTELLSKQSYSTMSDWFFQMVFVATTASIVSGALAERVRLWSFFAFIFILVSFIYPVVGAMTWGGGILAELSEKHGFIDFAGSTIVHSTGGWAALAGVLIVGPRIGKFRKNGTVHPTPPSNVPLVTLGVLILWLGWMGFNGGSVLAMDSPAKATIMSDVIANTVMAGAAGVLTVMALSKVILGRMSLLAVLNGAIAGLVSITAAPDFHNMIWLAIFIGAVGGLLCLITMRLFDAIKIDDVVSAIPAHLVAGIWGTMAVCFTNADSSLWVQFVGIIVVGAFTFTFSWIAWYLIDLIFGLRISAETEELGQDVTELGMETYPEFVQVIDHEMYAEELEEKA
ncbi:MAG: ammonium transporter [Gammaproteobacteria bacterium]|nr:ammonium transporter [Gammaproteobacteria bacterium]